MPTAANTSKPVKPQVRLLDLAGGPWLSLGHKLQPPALPSRFSAPKFTPEQQAEAPDQPRTRVVKDVLKVGRWKGEEDPTTGKRLMWDVTRETLLQIASDFREAQSRGLAANLTLSHGNPETLMVPTSDLIAPIDEVVVEGDVLWASAYVTPQQSKFLQNTAMKVSPGVVSGWTDGAGNLYRERLIHVAVVDNPVVMGQGPFRLLANDLPGGGEMDFATILDQFVRLFSLLGYTLNPEGVTEETLSATVETLLSDAESSEGETDDTNEDESTADSEDAGSMAEDEVPAMLSNADISKIKSPLVRTLMLQNQAILKRLGDQDKTDFEAAVARLKGNGLPEASAVMLLSNGKAKGWDKSLLAPLEAAFPGVAKTGPELGRKARTLANAKAPKLTPGVKDEEEAALEMILSGRKVREVKKN